MGDQTPSAVDPLKINDAAQKAQFSQRVLIKTILSRPDGGTGLAVQAVKVGGWVKIGQEANKGDLSLDMGDNIKGKGTIQIKKKQPSYFCQN